MPRPPPADTTAASSVVPTPPSTASWNGSRQPTRWVKRVSTVRSPSSSASLRPRDAAAAARRRRTRRLSRISAAGPPDPWPGFPRRSCPPAVSASHHHYHREARDRAGRPWARVPNFHRATAVGIRLWPLDRATRHRLSRNYLEALLAQRGVAADDR